MSCQQINYTHGTAGNFAVGLLSNNVLLCQTSRASRQRHRWNHRLHYWHRNSSKRSSAVAKCSSLSLSDSQSHWRLAAEMETAGQRRRQRSGGRHVFSVHLTLKATWVSAPETGYAADRMERLNHSHWEFSWGWDGVGGAGGYPGSSVVVRRRWCWWLAGVVGGAGG